MKSLISHEGTVEKNEHREVTVALSPGISCSGCAVAGSCGMAEKEQKKVTVSAMQQFKQGDKVEVLMSSSQGFTALLPGYLMPLLIVVAILVIKKNYNLIEGVVWRINGTGIRTCISYPCRYQGTNGTC